MLWLLKMLEKQHCAVKWSFGFYKQKKSPRKEMTSLYQRMLTNMVRAWGLEPQRITAREPKSRMSTNSIMPAYSNQLHLILHNQNRKVNAGGERKPPRQDDLLSG